MQKSEGFVLYNGRADPHFVYKPSYLEIFGLAGLNISFIVPDKSDKGKQNCQ